MHLHRHTDGLDNGICRYRHIFGTDVSQGSLPIGYKYHRVELPQQLGQAIIFSSSSKVFDISMCT